MRFCPKCGEDSAVVDCRMKQDNSFRRRRACSGCGEQWSTIEISLEQFESVARMRAVMETLRQELLPTVAIKQVMTDAIAEGRSRREAQERLDA